MSNDHRLIIHSHDSAVEICAILKKNGFQAYLVGGAVRDALLGIKSDDVDITTNARPKDNHALFQNAIDTGKAYGTVTVPCEENAKVSLQITTYRSDGVYSNQRHPDSIQFEDDIHQDLSRRDFSVNALAYDPISHELIDDFEGLLDLKERRLKTVGDPMVRFQEDSLRLFRLCRFASQLGFDVHKDTKEAFLRCTESVKLPAKERIQVELDKLMYSKQPSKGLFLIQESVLSDRLFPGLSRLSKEQLAHIDSVEHDLRWATLIADLNSDAVFELLLFSNKNKRSIKRLIHCGLDLKKANFTIKDLALSGKDIQSLGYSGLEIGAIQKQLHDYVREELSRNTKDTLLSYISELNHH